MMSSVTILYSGKFSERNIFGNLIETIISEIKFWNVATMLLLNYYSRSLSTETQKFFGNKFLENVQHFGNF